MLHANFWELVASGMGAVLLIVLTMLFKRVTSIDDKVDNIDAKFNQHLIHSASCTAQYVTKTDCKDCGPLIGIVERLEILHKAREIAWGRQEKVTDELWRELDGHSHEGLLQGSRVIRMPK